MTVSVTTRLSVLIGRLLLFFELPRRTAPCLTLLLRRELGAKWEVVIDAPGQRCVVLMEGIPGERHLHANVARFAQQGALRKRSASRVDR
jgi:hypothetical protein